MLVASPSAWAPISTPRLKHDHARQIIYFIAQDKLPRVADRLKQQQQQQPWTGSGMQSVGSTATTTVATSARTPLQNQSRQLPRQAANIYLNHMLSHVSNLFSLITAYIYYYYYYLFFLLVSCSQNTRPSVYQFTDVQK